MRAGFRDLIGTLWARHEIRYLVVAGATSVFSWSCIGLGLVLGWHYMVATVFGQIAPIPFAFPSYRSWVFDSRGRMWPDFYRFLSVWAGGAIIGVAAAPFLVEGLHFNPVVAQIFTTAVVAVGSYLSHRFFTFRTRAR